MARKRDRREGVPARRTGGILRRMATTLFRALILAQCLLSIAALTACGDDSSDPIEADGGGDGDGDGDGDGGGDGDGDGDGDSGVPGCNLVLSPSADDTEMLQTALIEGVVSGDTICLEPGEYRPTAELSLTAFRDITLKGLGETRDDVVIDFSDQETGDDGIYVTADGFTIENMWIKNSPGNGVVVSADDSVFRDLKVTWDAGSVTENGAYAVYPTNCNRTTVENVEVVGASDAGIYVGQCREAIVRGNNVHGNVIGIEVENTTIADVYDNTIEDNAVGILAVILPNLDKKDGGQVLLRENQVSGNDRENFAEEGTTAAAVPPGCGILVIGLPDVEIRDNTISDQTGPAVFVASYEIFELLSATPSDDPETDKWPKRIYIHGNMFQDVGTAPTGSWDLLGEPPIPAVIWDGRLAPGIETQAEMDVCLGEEEQMQFVKGSDGEVGGVLAEATRTSDTTDHECVLDMLPELEDF
jgi:parallel beta-helix repeat protein